MTAGSFGWKGDRARQHSLYPGQREALTYRAEGYTPTDTAVGMGISVATVSSYLGGAKVALGADSIDAAVRIAREQRLIPFRRAGA